jgi:hypothetical protein
MKLKKYCIIDSTKFPNIGKINRPPLVALGDLFWNDIFVSLQNFAQRTDRGSHYYHYYYRL